ncbi:MAG: glycosyltransferase [Opitutae bacterium]|nr:glycosyltransferase [Opitutae bacterium]
MKHSERMVVRVLTNTLAGGGAEKQLLLLLRGLGERGHDCSVYVLQWQPGGGRYAALLDEAARAGVHIVRPGRAGALSVLAALVAAVVRGPRGVLMCWGFRAELWRLLLPILWWPAGIVALRSASREVMRKRGWLLRATRLYAAGYLSNSELNVKLAQEVALGIESRAHVVPNAIEATFLSAARRGESAGRLEVRMLGNVRFWIKGYDQLLEIAQLACADGANVHFTVGGAQPTGETRLDGEIARRGMEGTVTWAGPIDDPVKFLAGADVFMLLSRYEGMPNALLEAMALGIPCIATEVGDLRRIAGESDGLEVVPIADARMAYAALVRLLGEPGRARAMGVRAREYCQAHFAEAAVTIAAERALHAVLERRER